MFRIRHQPLLSFFALLSIHLGCSCGNNSPTSPQAIISDPATSTPIPTSTTFLTTTPSPTTTLSLTTSPTFTQTSTDTPTPPPTRTPTTTGTFTSTWTPTNTASSTPTPTSSATFTPTPTNTSTFSPTRTTTNTPTATSTSTPTSTPTACAITTPVGNNALDNSANPITYSSTDLIATAVDIYLSPVFIPTGGNIQVKDVYLYFGHFTSAMTGFVGLYTDTGGAPQSLIASASFSIPASSGTQVALPDPLGHRLILPGGSSYWIALAPTNNGIDMGYHAGGGSVFIYNGDAGGKLSSLPQSLGNTPATLVGSSSVTVMAAQLEYCH